MGWSMTPGDMSAPTITRPSSQTAACTRPGAGVRRGTAGAGRRGSGKESSSTSSVKLGTAGLCSRGLVKNIPPADLT